MTIVQVHSSAEEKLFYKVPDLIYKDEPRWIKPLHKDIADVFDLKKNKAYRFGKLVRWVLLDEDQNPIGRIAAFINKKYKNKGDEQVAGGVGFFECINVQDAADLLLDNAKHWLIQEGAAMMDGPINFGERDKWWGMVSEGFQSPVYGMNYNPAYYNELFERYGFKSFYQQICYGMDLKKPLQQKIWDRHDSVAENQSFSAEHLKKNNLEKYASDFTEVYNKAWAGHGGLKQISKEQVVAMFKKMKPVMDERIVWFAYHEKKPIAIFINLPDLNQWFKYLNGKFGLFHKLYFLWIRHFIKNQKCTGLVFGIIPEFQGKGLDSYIIAEAAKLIQSEEMPYKQYEMQWIGDFNPKMLNIASNLGDVYISRKLTTYRYLFDRTQPFARHPIL